jgi:hypothetical protein
LSTTASWWIRSGVRCFHPQATNCRRHRHAFKVPHGLMPYCSSSLGSLRHLPSIVSDGKATPRPLHGVCHSFDTSSRPVFTEERCLDPDKLRTAEAEFQNLEKSGIICRSSSPCSSLLHMVPKPDGTWRPCSDFRCLNLVTKPDKYPLPPILDFFCKVIWLPFFFVLT